MSFEVHRGEELRHSPAVDLHDIQATVLRYRPEPYFGTHFFLHINDAQGGREFLRRLAPHIGSAADWWNAEDAWIAVAISYTGLGALGVPEDSLQSFPEAFQWEWLRVLRSFVTTEQTIRRTGTSRSVADRFTSRSALSAIPKRSGAASWRRPASSIRASRASPSC